MCGTAELPELVENLRFTPEDIDYLASLQAPAGGAMFKLDSSTTCTIFVRM